MLRICICDDSKEDGIINEELVRKFFLAKESAFVIEIFSSPFEVLDRAKDFEIFVLDMQMDEMNGIELARNIRNENKDSFIVAVTGFSDYADAALVIGLDGYVWKPVSESKLSPVMERGIIQCQSKKYEIEVFDQCHDRHNISIRDVLCVYTNDRKAEVKTLQGEFFCVKTFKELREELLSLDFAEVGKKYLVNLIFVKGIAKEWISFGTDKISLKEFFRRGYEIRFRESLSSYGRRKR